MECNRRLKDALFESIPKIQRTGSIVLPQFISEISQNPKGKIAMSLTTSPRRTPHTNTQVFTSLPTLPHYPIMGSKDNASHADKVKQGTNSFQVPCYVCGTRSTFLGDRGPRREECPALGPAAARVGCF